MERRTIRRTIVSVGLTVIFLLAACLIAGYFAFGANLREVSIPSYVIATRVGDRYEFTLDLDRLIWDQRLCDPPESAISAFPEIAAIRTLALSVEHDDAGYHFKTMSTSSDPDFSQTIKRAGIVLKNTQWTWTEADIIGRSATQPTDGFTVLNLPDYVRVFSDGAGGYTVSLDNESLLEDCRFSLPLDPNTHSGYVAIMSLSVGCTQADGGYRLQAQSTLQTIMEQLAENRIRISNTAWTWTTEQMNERSQAFSAPGAAVDPSAQSPAADSAVSDPTAEAAMQTGSGAAEASAERKDGISTLYGFNQTSVRTAIRNAKEAHYGSRFESGSVYANYFAVGTPDTPHANCFRLVYEITTTGGTEYLIADVYDLQAESGYTAADVTLKTVASRNEARATDDLADYTLYTLNGGSMVFPENAGKTPFDAAGLVMEKSIRESVTYDELWDLVQTQDLTLLQLLAFARNEMFARAGHTFDTSGSYYRHFASYKWYEPAGTVSTNDLAAKWPSTAANISTIKFLEKLIREG